MKGTTALIVLIALTVTGGCAGGSTPTAASSPPPATTAASPSPSPSSSSQAREVTAAATTWATTPVTVTHEPPVPPVPVVTGIRYAAHSDGFDRIVLDIPGALPGYQVKYVTEVRSDGSGEPVPMPGAAFLLIVLHPAQAHRDDGTPTVTGTHRTGLATIKAYAVAGDYEGYVTIALGLSGKHKFHVGELTNRIYVDVAV
ncbi:AMIN-like domain-containing (lipo)protein [Actinoplanes sp. CA-142083]|uniref:AMIN-like domain-containing (lipo)protein n=1 Tax=Actinoplanes sp. CA-142083 TaxID=3239903 RepID=UPI003D89F93B